MTKISINLLRWSTPWDEIERCIDAILNSNFQAFELTYMENPHGTASSLVDQVQKHFGHDSRLRVVMNDSNLGYAGAHNRFFAENNNELLMVLNPDAILDPCFLENIIRPFSDAKVGAVTGKMLKPRTSADEERVLDGTGIELYRTRRARERGQLEIDRGQYDHTLSVFGVSGTAAVYRKSSLEAVKIGGSEYFDPDFFAYWEDFDLSWRLRLRGFDCVYVPEAIVEHSRAVGSSPVALYRFRTFIRHHKSFPLWVRQWSWQNHLFAIIKNDFGWCLYRDLPQIIFREVAILVFITLFMPDTLAVLPKAAKLLSRMLQKRALIQSARTVDSSAICRFFQ